MSLIESLIIICGLLALFIGFVLVCKLGFDWAYNHIARFRAEVDWLTAASADWD